MNFSVRLEVTGIGEFLMAKFALIRRLPCVDANMSVVAANMTEGFPANLACIRFHACMYPHVVVQVGFVHKAMVAFSADVFLIHVNLHVRFQVSLRSEISVAVDTCKRTRAMNPFLVIRESALVSERKQN